MIDKRALLDALRATLKEELDTQTRRAREAAEAATHEENRPENDKDMRSTEASYVAKGQADRALALEDALRRLAGLEPRAFGPGDVIQATALVRLEVGGQERTVFVLPAGGGVELDVPGSGRVACLATTSPLGRALLGLTEGDEAEVHGPQGVRAHAILSVT